MSMTATLYNNSSNNNVVHKSLSSVATVNIEATEGFSVDNGRFRMTRNDNYLNVNYMYVPDLHRYYFIQVEIENGSFMIINAESDPLTSFWDYYKNSSCIAKRSSNKPDIRIEDDRILKLQKPTIITRRVGASFEYSTSNNYVLTVAGKGIGT